MANTQNSEDPDVSTASASLDYRAGYRAGERFRSGEPVIPPVPIPAGDWRRGWRDGTNGVG